MEKGNASERSGLEALVVLQWFGGHSGDIHSPVWGGGHSPAHIGKGLSSTS